MLETMNEFDEIWAQKLDEAIDRANADGRQDVADYLTLKAVNDAARQKAAHWLFGAILEIAAGQPQIRIENDTSHRFTVGAAQMVGAALRLRQGVRCLTVEAGWTRTPNDGFMRGGALACARLTHFGMAKYNAELVLLPQTQIPQWFAVDENGGKSLFEAENIVAHFHIFVS